MRRDEFSVRDLVLAGLLLAIGFVMHGVFPPILAGMKPDFSLMMLFAFIMMGKDKRISLVAGLATGIITALTTTFPGGQIPNIVDKLVTTGVVMALVAVLPMKLRPVTIGVLGTIVSGFVFLGTAFVLSGLPAPFMALVVSVVLPAAAVNTAALLVMYPIIDKLEHLRRRPAMVTR